MAEARDLRDAIDVAIVGSGPLAVMLAGEISQNYLEMSVEVLIDQDTLLPGFPKEAVAIVEQVLSERGVRFVRDCHIRNVALESHPVITMRDGTHRKYTRAYLCQATIPNTQFMELHYALALNSTRHLRVTATFQMSLQDNIFVVGQASSFARPTEEADITRSVEQAFFVSRNIMRLARGRDLRKYKRVAPPRIPLDATLELVQDRVDTQWKLVQHEPTVDVFLSPLLPLGLLIALSFLSHVP